MEDQKIKFSDLYENFTGSGNINGKYWIVGLESGGQVGKELKEKLENKNLGDLLNYLSNFEDEVEYKGFLDLQKKIISGLGIENQNIVKAEDGIEKFVFPNDGLIFRTNLLPLVYGNTNKETIENNNSIYQQYIEFEERDIDKWQLFINNKAARINRLKTKMNKRPEVIFLVYRAWEKEVIANFFSPLLDASYNYTKSYEMKIDSNTYYISLYDSDEKIKIISFPQQHSVPFPAAEINKAIQELINL